MPQGPGRSGCDSSDLQDLEDRLVVPEDLFDCAVEAVDDVGSADEQVGVDRPGVVEPVGGGDQQDVVTCSPQVLDVLGLPLDVGRLVVGGPAQIMLSSA